ncbi:hypothetical protein IWX47DRAFT_651472 [Phyllosticta citricarpa]
MISACHHGVKQARETGARFFFLFFFLFWSSLRALRNKLSASGILHSGLLSHPPNSSKRGLAPLRSCLVSTFVGCYYKCARKGFKAA